MMQRNANYGDRANDNAISLTTSRPAEAKLPAKYDGPANDGLDPGVVSLFEVECRRTFRTIKLLGGNKSRVAEVLGVDRRAFFRRLRQYRSDRST